MSDKSQIDDISHNWKVLFTEVLNSIADAQDNGLPRIIVTFDLDHSTKNIQMTIHEARIPKDEFIQ